MIPPSPLPPPQTTLPSWDLDSVPMSRRVCPVVTYCLEPDALAMSLACRLHAMQEVSYTSILFEPLVAILPLPSSFLLFLYFFTLHVHICCHLLVGACYGSTMNRPKKMFERSHGNLCFAKSLAPDRTAWRHHATQALRNAPAVKWQYYAVVPIDS